MRIRSLLYSFTISHVRTGSLVRYVVVGIEVGASGTPHLQWYLETATTQRRAAIHKIIGLERAFIEPARASKDENYRYCIKEGNWREFGKAKPGVSGKRTDLDAVKEAIDGGANLRDISQRFFGTYVRYPQGLRGYYDLNQVPADRKNMKIVWFWGPTGTGKSRRCLDLISSAPNGWTSYSLTSSPTGTWYTGYCGEQIMYVDEFRGGWMKHDAALRLFDRTPYLAPVHGGKVPLCVELLLVTSNLPPHMCFDVDDGGAFMRRIEDYADVYEMCMDVVNVRKAKY